MKRGPMSVKKQDLDDSDFNSADSSEAEAPKTKISKDSSKEDDDEQETYKSSVLQGSESEAPMKAPRQMGRDTEGSEDPDSPGGHGLGFFRASRGKE
jgi:hypothetical protein